MSEYGISDHQSRRCPTCAGVWCVLTIETVKHPRSRQAAREERDRMREGGREREGTGHHDADAGEGGREGRKSEGGLAAVAPGNGINKGREGEGAESNEGSAAAAHSPYSRNVMPTLAISIMLAHARAAATRTCRLTTPPAPSCSHMHRPYVCMLYKLD